MQTSPNIAFAAGLWLSLAAHAATPAVEAPDFTINVVLSDEARSRLQAYGETVVVNVTFADTIGPGEHYLGGMRHESFTDGSLPVRNVVFDPKDVAALDTTNYEVLVNVASGRHAFDMNVLDCDFLQDRIGNLQHKVHTLKCGLGKWAPAQELFDVEASDWAGPGTRKRP